MAIVLWVVMTILEHVFATNCPYSIMKATASYCYCWANRSHSAGYPADPVLHFREIKNVWKIDCLTCTKKCPPHAKSTSSVTVGICNFSAHLVGASAIMIKCVILIFGIVQWITVYIASYKKLGLCIENLKRNIQYDILTSYGETCGGSFRHLYNDIQLILSLPSHLG